MSEDVAIPPAADTPLPPSTRPSIEAVPPSFNQERPTPLDANQIQARRRPRAVVLVYVVELVWALLIGAPAHAWARRIWGQHPDGDAVLWNAGGRELMASLMGLDPAFGVTVRTSILFLVIGAVVSQVLTGALLVSLGTERVGRRAIRARTALAEGINLWLPMTTVLVIASLAELAIAGLGLTVGTWANHASIASFGDAMAFRIGAVVMVVGLVVACLAGVFFDLVRAAIAREATTERSASAATTRLVSAFRLALGVGFRRYFRAVGAWSWRALLGYALLAVGWIAADHLGGRGGGFVVALFCIHQVIVLVRIALRAAYYARALSIVADTR